MNRNVIETVMGAVVIAVAALFLVFAYRSSNVGTVAGYEVTAQFGSTGGLQTGADVRISGVKVGSVVGQTLDPASFLAVIRLSIDPAISLPADTVAAIRSESLLGGRYVGLEPGSEEEKIRTGGRIQYTQNPVDLEDLIGRFMFSTGGSQGGGSQGGGSQGGAPQGGASGSGARQTP